MLKECNLRSSIDRYILKEPVTVLDLPDKHGDADSRPERFREQLTAGIDLPRWRLAGSGARIDKDLVDSVFESELCQLRQRSRHLIQ